MKTFLFRITLLTFLFSFHSSFAQTITKKRGKVTTHYADGKKESSGKVKKYKKQGIWKYWDSDGHLSYTQIYKDDVKNGLCTVYYTDGSKSMEGNYLNGKQDGIWHGWWANHNYLNEMSYKNGLFDGICKYWYPNKQLERQVKYSSDTLLYDWAWYDNGAKKSVEYYLHGLKTGTWRVYPQHPIATDTFPSSIINYANGKKNGVSIQYANGKLFEETYFKDNLMEGSHKAWNNGSLVISEIFKNGLLDGESKYYRQDIIRTVQYSKGKINGFEKQVNGEGMMISMNWYKQGRLDSAFTYHPNGKLATSRVYMYYPGFVRTEQFSIYSEYDNDGHLLLKGKFHFEEKDQDWTTYYPTGKTKSITPYSAGKIKGVYKKWYANGKEMIEYECEGNNVVSTPKVWDEKGKPIKKGTTAYQEIVDSSLPGEIYNNPNQYKDNHLRDVIQINFPDPNEPEVISDASEVPPNDLNMVFTWVDVMPQFPGGEDSLRKFLTKNIKYPSMDPHLPSGTVYMSFIVETDGSITNIRAKKEVKGAPYYTEEATRVIKLMPKWIPGSMNGKVVRVEYNQPIRFVTQ